MRNKYLRFADVLFLLSFVAGTTMMACSEQPHQPTLKATYNKPAKTGKVKLCLSVTVIWEP